LGLHVAHEEAGDHAEDDEDGDTDPDPFDNFFGVLVVEETHK
jgi:hypothetical protein